MVLTGSDRLAEEGFERLRGAKTGLLCNSASVTSGLRHISDILISSKVALKALFGPQHGYYAQTQANMIEWETHPHSRLGIPVYSLYGERRKPSSEMIEGLDTVVVDLTDIGTRCYTYLWTATLMMRALSSASIPMIVLDRPNPIGGVCVEGPMLKKGYESFVGLFPLALRHGMTMGECLLMIAEEEGLGSKPEIVKVAGWRREMYFDETGLPWVLPSPNIPTPDSAIVYPGAVLFEGTNLSEGRGTTRPFEIIGAPWIDPYKLAGELSSAKDEGVFFRPVRFKPVSDKFRNIICGGIQIHVTDRRIFRPVRTAARIISAVVGMYPAEFEWSEPPYEYEEKIMPIDIITGSGKFREGIDSYFEVDDIFRPWEEEERAFINKRKEYLIY